MFQQVRSTVNKQIYLIVNIGKICSKNKIGMNPLLFSDVFTADVALTLTKAKNKAASTLKTAIDSIAVTGTVTRKFISIMTG